jgi:predicted kinase
MLSFKKAAPSLVVFCGLPGAGKTTLARAVAAELGATLVRVDALEAALARSLEPPLPDDPVGYALAHTVAAEQLSIGRSVVVDAVNALLVARIAWQGLAHREQARHFLVEVTCSDTREHRRRVEGRRSVDVGLVPPSWSDVTRRVFQPCEPQLRVDNLGPVARHVASVVRLVRGTGEGARGRVHLLR